MAEAFATRLSVEILQLQNIPIVWARRTAIYSSPSSATLLIAARRLARRMDSNSTAVHTENGSREQNHAHFVSRNSATTKYPYHMALFA